MSESSAVTSSIAPASPSESLAILSRTNFGLMSHFTANPSNDAAVTSPKSRARRQDLGATAAPAAPSVSHPTRLFIRKDIDRYAENGQNAHQLVEMNGGLAVFNIPQKANSDIGNLRQLDLSRPLSLSLSANNACDFCH